jgi:hypothetical protein
MPTYKKTSKNSGPKVPPLLKHESHNVEIRLYTGPKHTAYYRCIDCDKWVSWLSRSETNQALELNLIETGPR